MSSVQEASETVAESPIRRARDTTAIADGPTLPDYAIREIAARAGRGWYFAEKPRVAMSRELQELRLATYKKVVPIAQAYATGVEGLSHRTRDAIWAHVCAECDIRWAADHPDRDKAEQAMAAGQAFAMTSDPDVQQAFVAWASYRASGGQERFEQWRQEWMKQRGGQDGPNT